jgi:hypothetical protein
LTEAMTPNSFDNYQSRRGEKSRRGANHVS